MLSPEQVLPFLLHEDADVRSHALGYFADAHDPAPATADHFWEAVDRFGIDAFSRRYGGLSALPQTDASITRALTALVETEPDTSHASQLLGAISEAPLEIVRARRAEIFNAAEITESVRKCLADRIELAEVPLADLWERLLKLSADRDAAGDGGHDWRAADRLTEALSRHGEAAAALAMDRLTTGPDEDWMEIFAVQLLGKLRHGPAAAHILKRMEIDTDILREEAVRALVGIGTVDVVQRIEAFYPGKPWHVRLYADDPLGRIKRPESERAILNLLKHEDKPDLIGSLGYGLCELCTTEGLEAVREMIVQKMYDPQMAELDEPLLAVGKMVGYEPPEAAAWREKIAEREAARERRMQEFAGPRGLDALMREMKRRFIASGGNFSGDDWNTDPDNDIDRLRPAPDAIVPIRRESPKVGRNDPCPCGSGKKYKKCCQSKATA
jgi:hypothetical protein